jgi:hypothetical protein
MTAAAAAAAPAAAAAAPGADGGARARPTVLLLDVMDTLVSDPFYEAMPRHFGMPFRELLDAKHPTAWVEFERGEIGEPELLAKFFKDGRAVDGEALTRMMREQYRILDGIEPLLARLKAAGVPMHACSNYPVWWRNVEASTRLGRWIEWTFVSCEGPMRVEFFFLDGVFFPRILRILSTARASSNISISISISISSSSSSSSSKTSAPFSQKPPPPRRKNNTRPTTHDKHKNRATASRRPRRSRR